MHKSIFKGYAKYNAFLCKKFCRLTLFLGLLAYSSHFVAYSAAVSPTGEIVLERSGSAWNPPIPGLLKVAIFVLFVLFFIQVIWKLKQRLTNSNE